MQLTKFLTLALVALVFCSAALAHYNEGQCGCTIVGGGLLGLLGTVVIDVVGLVGLLLFDVSAFFIENGRLMCRGRQTLHGVPGITDQTSYGSWPVSHVDCNRDAEGKCQFLAVHLEGLDLGIAGLEIKLNHPITVTVGADSEYVIGDVLCDLLGPSGGEVGLLDISALTTLSGYCSKCI